MKKLLPFIISSLLFSCSENPEEKVLSCVDEKFSTSDLKFENFLGYVDSAMVAQKYIPDHSREAYLGFCARGQQALIHVKGNTTIEKWIDHEKHSNLVFLQCYQHAFAENDSPEGERFYQLLKEMEKAGNPISLLQVFYLSLSDELFNRPTYKCFFIYLLMADRKIVMDYPEQVNTITGEDSTTTEPPLEEVPVVEFTPPQVEEVPVE